MAHRKQIVSECSIIQYEKMINSRTLSVPQLYVYEIMTRHAYGALEHFFPEETAQATL